MNRDQIIIRTSRIGILTNIILCIFKAIIGLITNSIAIVLDAVNNFSDALSSLITIVGTKLSTRAPDKKHPFGYGRVEYITSTVIAIIILYAGFTSFLESIKKILNPVIPEYTNTSLFILVVAVIVKVLIGTYFKKVGKSVNSDSLINSGQDALMDSLLSMATIVAAIIFLLTKVSTEAYLGLIISFIILKSGFDMLNHTMSQILGERVDASLSKEVKETINSMDGVYGAYDLVLNDYGPDRLLGSIHIEVPANMTAEKIDALTREITATVNEKHKVILSAIGIYALNTTDHDAIDIETEIRKYVNAQPHVEQCHGFYVDRPNKTIHFDMIIDFDTPNRQAIYERILNDLKKKYPDYTFSVILDTDFSD
ncbi:MAG: cation transporter [Solobacterium sp.]|nr:cation transporter [Solobacterium sp.]